MEQKKWYQSITLWGAKIVAVAMFLPDLVALIDAKLGLSLATNPIVIKVLGVAGLLVVVYGRLTAKVAIK